MVHKIIALVAAVCFMSACKKTDPEVEPKPEVQPLYKDSYYPLKIGNQWVYDVYAFSQDGEKLIVGARDTVTVEKDTLIDQQIYYKLVHSNPQYYGASRFEEALRDSAGYIVGPWGTIQFSPNFTSFDTISTNISYNGSTTLIYKAVMKDNGDEVTVPSGTFKVVTYENNVFENGKKLIPGPFQYFAKGVGRVFEQNRYASDANAGFRKKLVSYQLK